MNTFHSNPKSKPQKGITGGFICALLIALMFSLTSCPKETGEREGRFTLNGKLETSGIFRGYYTYYLTNYSSATVSVTFDIYDRLDDKWTYGYQVTLTDGASNGSLGQKDATKIIQFSATKGVTYTFDRDGEVVFR